MRRVCVPVAWGRGGRPGAGARRGYFCEKCERGPGPCLPWAGAPRPGPARGARRRAGAAQKRSRGTLEERNTRSKNSNYQQVQTNTQTRRERAASELPHKRAPSHAPPDTTSYSARGMALRVEHPITAPPQPQSPRTQPPRACIRWAPFSSRTSASLYTCSNSDTPNLPPLGRACDLEPRRAPSVSHTFSSAQSRRRVLRA